LREAKSAAPKQSCKGGRILARFRSYVLARRYFYGWCALRKRSSTVFTGLKVSRGTSTKTVFQNAIDPFHSPGSSSAFSSPSS